MEKSEANKIIEKLEANYMPENFPAKKKIWKKLLALLEYQQCARACEVMFMVVDVWTSRGTMVDMEIFLAYYFRAELPQEGKEKQ